MIDHVSLQVSDLARSAAFYDAVLLPLGLARMVEREGTIGFGKRYPEVWLNLRKDYQARRRTPARTSRFAHRAKRRFVISTSKRSHTAAATRARPVRAKRRSPPTLAPSSSTPTATSWKRSIFREPRPHKPSADRIVDLHPARSSKMTEQGRDQPCRAFFCF